MPPLKFLVFALLLTGCSPSDRDQPVESHPSNHWFEMDTPMGHFLSAASKGPVDSTLCNKYGGKDIAPIDYEEPAVIAQGVAIYKRKRDGQPFVGVSFTTSNSVIFVLKTCAWPATLKK